MMKKKGKFLSIVLAGIMGTSLSFSSEKKDNPPVNIPRFGSPPKIDGKLENPVWEKGAVLDSFTQYEPQEGTQPSEKTVAYIGYNDKNLYIAVRCFDSNPHAVRACLTQRDKVHGDDGITVYLDTFNDKKRAFVFQVNPCGVQTDGIYTETRRRGRGRSGGFFGFDRSFDTFFFTNAQIDEEGYSVEFSIPFKSLRFPNKQPQIWGLQIMRNIRRKNEEIYWYPRSRDVNGFLVQAGTIQIDGQIEKGRNLEVMPVLTNLMERKEKLDPQPGINLKYGITSDLTADVTLNPDFSQVEADMPQIEVNKRYAVYYPEKRPFFLEGKDFFDTPFELVYTRTIVNPIWGTKLTGKVGKTTLGFISAYDETPTGIDIPCEEEFDLSHKKALVNVIRLKQDLYPESHIGFILTDKELGSSWTNISQNFNRVAGIDGHFKFKNYYRFSFQIVGSQSKLGKDTTPIVPALNLSFSRKARHLSISLDYHHIPEDFEASLGFFRRKDIRSFSSRISYAFLPQNDVIVDIRPSIRYQRVYDFDNILTDEELRLGWFISGWRGSHIYGGFTSELERYNGVDFHKKSFRASFSSNPFSWLTGNISFSFGDAIYYDEHSYLGYKTSYGFMLTLKPLTNLKAFYRVQNNTFCKTKGGEKVYSINILGQRITYQLSRPLSIRLITDYNDYSKEIYTSILFSYQLRPGTVFYIGVDDNQEQNETGAFRVQGRFYFIKFSYWWRI